MRQFGHVKPTRDDTGTITGSRSSPVRVRTVEPLGTGYGPDKDKRLILTAHHGDLVGLRPERTSRELLITAQDLYSYMIRCQANLVTLAKARERKERKQTRLAQQRQARAEKRLFRK